MAGTTPVIVNTRRGFLDHTGIRARDRIPLSLHHSTDEVTLHHMPKQDRMSTIAFLSTSRRF